MEELICAGRKSNGPVEVSFRQLIGPLPVNDLTHSAYPYPARLLRQIPRFLLHCRQFGLPGDAVLDPFCGSGTVLVEAMSAGRPAWGIDANPFARLLTSVKTTPLREDWCIALSAEVLARAIECRSVELPDVVNVEHWYTRSSLLALGRLRRAIMTQGVSDAEKNFLLVALAVTAEKVSLRDPRIPVPVRRKDYAANAASQTAAKVFEHFGDSALTLAAQVGSLMKCDAKAILAGQHAADAAKTYQDMLRGKWGRPSLVLSSPPYGAAQKYIRSTSLALGWTGLATPTDLTRLNRDQIGREHLSKAERQDLSAPDATTQHEIDDIAKVDTARAAIYARYYRDMHSAIASVCNVLEPGGTVVLIAGTNMVAGRPIATHKRLRKFAIDQGLLPVIELRDRIRGRVLLTKRASSGSPLRYENIHILRKEE